MASIARVTVTIPDDLLKDIDRHEKNRSRFFAEAVRRELDRRRRSELRRSLNNPHPEGATLAESGFREWSASLPDEDTAALVEKAAGKPIRWLPGKGWVERRS